MRHTKLAVGMAALLASVGLTSCSSVEVSPPIESCHDYRVNSQFGRFGIQQSARGKSIQWGTYPNATYSGTNYKVTVRANGTKIDSKNQNYAPHGSVSAARAAKYSGKILQVAGTVTRGGKLVLEFNMQCRIM